MPIPFWAGYYIGLPFEEHGRTISGLDCWGLVRLVFGEQYNICLPSYAQAYDSTNNEKELGPLIRKESSKWRRIKKGQEQLGDVIVMRIRGEPMHVGLVLGDHTMLHVQRNINSCIEKYKKRRWKGRIIGFFRHRGME